jgi:[acyl-carrier-protein] S-malonyltransferase
VSVALIFPGQGSQYAGMGQSLATQFDEAKTVFAAADDALGFALSKLCFEGPEAELKKTEVTQPAILTVSVAAHAVFSNRCEVVPVCVAGHSLGEYSALVAAKCLTLSEAVRAVRARGQFMQQAVPEGVGAMAAVLGLEATKVDSVCQSVSVGDECVVSCANYNEPMQTVIAGHLSAVEAASVALKAAGAKRVVPLPVSAPFHCALMKPVQEKLRGVLQAVSVAPLRCPVVTNVEARANAEHQRVVELLVSQVVAPVRFTESVLAMKAMGVTAVVELGPGRVLSGLVRRIDSSLTCHNVEDVESLNKTLAALKSAMA